MYSIKFYNVDTSTYIPIFIHDLLQPCTSKYTHVYRTYIPAWLPFVFIDCLSDKTTGARDMDFVDSASVRYNTTRMNLSERWDHI